MSQSELSELREKVTKLENQVKKNSKAIVDTGSQVLRIQVDEQKQGMKSLDLTADKQKDESDDEDANAEPLSSEDLVELVTELQEQLDLLDERSIRRMANAVLTNDEDIIAPVPRRVGGYPDDEATGEEEDNRPGKFPRTLQEFKEISDDALNYWLRWYELLPPDEQELQDMLSKAGATMEELGLEKPPASAMGGSKEDNDSNFDQLARFLGLRTRRTAGVW